MTGKLEGVLWHEVEEHIESCHRCIERMDGLEIRGDDYIARLVQANQNKENEPTHAFSHSQANPASLIGLQVDEAATITGPILNDSDTRSANSEEPMPSAPDFRVIERIGGGGMGQVYLAEQLRPVRREVAIKIIRADSPTAEILARFEAERQALALMSHPNIAQIFHAGSTDDMRPFIAMELVQGVPITKYCDAERLPITRRLELFVQICRAMQHAHQKGIIHRDIKPSNILVTTASGEAAVKIIDFGLAKALRDDAKLTDQTLHTRFGLILGTPDYMSPEQAGLDGLDVDTRSDVYSLGVLLYELLVGATPFGNARQRATSLDEILTLIRHTDPPRPSSYIRESTDDLEALSYSRQTSIKNLSLLLRRDLDWITFKALEKDRSRRYEGVAALADDVERYLRNEPVMARPPTLGYVVRKIYRKHKAGFLAGATTLAILVLALWGTGAMWLVTYRAEQAASQALENEKRANEEIQKQRNDLRDALSRVELERENADRNLLTARQSVDQFFATISENRLLNMPDMHDLRSELLREGVGYYDRFVNENASNPSLRAELAAAHFRVAQATFTPEPASLLLTLEAFGQGIVILEELLAAPEGSVTWGSLANGVYKGRMRFPPGQRPEIPRWQATLIRPIALRACDAWQQLEKKLPDKPGVKNDLAGMYNILALIEHSAGQWNNSISSYSSAIKIWESLAEGVVENENYLSEIAMGCSNMAKVYRDLFDQNGEQSILAAAIDLQTRATEMSKQIVQRFAPNPPPSFVIDASSISRDLCEYLILSNNFDAARDNLETAKLLLQKMGRESTYEKELAALEVLANKIAVSP